MNELSRANWTKEDTKKFCEIYCIQIDVGNCKNGNMSKWGWIDVQDRFLAATGKLHDSEQFGHRELKKLWVFIEELRHTATGIGNREDGYVVASDKWWEDKLGANKVKQEWLDLKDGWPEYIDEMDRMFAGVVVTGKTAFVPGASRHLNFISSGDEEEAPADFGTPSRASPQNVGSPHSRGTPLSSGSKRTASSTRSAVNKSWQ